MNLEGIPGQKYEYTKIDEVMKLCPRRKPRVSANDKTNIYPNPFSYDMSFDMSAKNSRGVVSWGSSVPFSAGSRFFNQHWHSMKDAYSVASTEAPVSAPVSYSYNISYKISIKVLSNAKRKPVHDRLQKSGLKESTSTNQRILLIFPPANSSGFIKGGIESKRKKSDPLYFEHLDLSSAAGYADEAEQSISRMDVEITLALVSTTLACIFVALQLFHVKNHPDVLPSISIFMKAFLGVGSSGWLEVNEVIVRALTMVGFLLKLRLLSLTWSARSVDNGTQNELWVMEKKAFIVALPVYVAGTLAVLFLMDWRKIGTDNDVVLSDYHEHPILGALKSYAGLVLDSFLLPQILLNMFCKSKEKSLSVLFYMGTTFVRVLPHAYDLYRSYSSAHHQLNEAYIYASPVADFYSTAWDVIIPFVGLLFVGIIYLQQKFGGLCIVPQKLRELRRSQLLLKANCQSDVGVTLSGRDLNL
ncbi:unnamed protein product [Prunus armeniaca]|uniref:RING-type E3 ubiquitin transferase n=1 Tax=Prunus armeniaca TaxID=36596 RepID=A0A6J5UNR6_PRUAR|nr:unnamed protein product [Prunus armeniaca]